MNLIIFSDIFPKELYEVPSPYKRALCKGGKIIAVTRDQDSVALNAEQDSSLGYRHGLFYYSLAISLVQCMS